MPEWDLYFEDNALQDLDGLSLSAREQVLEKLEWIRNHFSEMHPIPLGGAFRGFFKLRVGDYRVLYDIRWSSHRLIVVVVEHRSRVYRRKR